MAAYMVLDIEWHDQQVMEAYRQTVAPLLEQYGATLVLRDTNTIVLEGDWTPAWLVVFEFPSIEQAKAFYEAPAYRELLPRRLRASTANVILVEGVVRSG